MRRSGCYRGASSKEAVFNVAQAKAVQLALFADPGVGQPDRRYQVAVREHRQDHRVDPVGLAGSMPHPLDAGTPAPELSTRLLEQSRIAATPMTAWGQGVASPTSVSSTQESRSGDSEASRARGRSALTPGPGLPDGHHFWFPHASERLGRQDTRLLGTKRSRLDRHGARARCSRGAIAGASPGPVGL